MSSSIARLALMAVVCLQTGAIARHPEAKLYSIKAMAADKYERTKISEAGIAIDTVYSNSVGFIGTEQDLLRVKKLGIKTEVIELTERKLDFPAADKAFHTHQQTVEALDAIAAKYPAIATRFSIGKSLEGRELGGIRLSGNAKADQLPTAIFLGCHHAREHLSVEVPLKLAQHLASNYESNKRIRQLLDSREVWIVPMVNPDGAEHDIKDGSYKYWRKNRRDNGDGTFGVDLNRNYSVGFGGTGSSASTSSDTYHGPAAFSEPETAAVRDFVRSHHKTTILLTFHTFSELVLWPYSHTYDQIPSKQDQAVFETMGKQMATWNHYTPQKSSELYLSAGETTDWAYEELKIFAFTFELTPSSMFAGGFYPGAQAIEPTFQANLEPALYLLDKAENPYGVVNQSKDPLGFIK